MTVLIIPDTNVLYSDPFLEGPLVKTILAAERRTDVRMVIPEIVADELRGHVEEKLKQVTNDVNKARRDYAKLAGLDSYFVDLTIDLEQRANVLERFERFVQQLRNEGRLLRYPTVSPKELSQRSIGIQAPFRDQDRGLRDTLIWLSIKECLIDAKDTGTKVILVTNDKVFLDNSRTNLDQDLLDELIESKVSFDLISVQHDLQGVINAYVSSNLSAVEWVITAIEGGRISDFTDSDDKVQLRMTDWAYANIEFFSHPLDGVLPGYLFVEFDVMEKVHLERIERTLDLGNNGVLVDSKWRAEAAVEAFENRHFGESIQVSLIFTVSSMRGVHNHSLQGGDHA